jgi:2-dehydropantoate 2-reductase
VSEAKILFIGPGAVGASVAAWVAENYRSVFVMGHGETQAALHQNGITIYAFEQPEETRRTVRVATVDRPADVGDVDIVVLAVKNYSLEALARQVREELGDRPIVVSMANGIDNQRILPKFFSKVIYGVVGYNARRDEPVVVGYQRKGPLLISTPDNKLGDELRLVQSILARGCPTEITDRLQDAVHTKIVINLTNALDALIGRGARPLSNLAVYQQLLSQTLSEGVRIVRSAGYREHRIAGIPPFALLHLIAVLPGWLTRPLFKRELRAMRMSSMTQDVVLRGAGDTELESITGYIVRLAAEHGVPAPYNRAIYRLGREKFRPGFTPLRCEAVLAAVEREREEASSPTPAKSVRL